MVIDSSKKEHMLAERRTQRLRRQRVLHSNGYSTNGEGSISASSMQHKQQLLVSTLGWSKKEAADNHAQLKNFARFWDGPGMEEYDEM